MNKARISEAVAAAAAAQAAAEAVHETQTSDVASCLRGASYEYLFRPELKNPWSAAARSSGTPLVNVYDPWANPESQQGTCWDSERKSPQGGAVPTGVSPRGGGPQSQGPKSD